MRYLYIATTRDGQEERGVVEARDVQGAAEQIRHMGLMLISLKRDSSSLLANLLGFGWITNLTKVTFTKHLALMIQAGLPIDESIRILRDQATGRFRKILAEILKAVESGRPLSEALTRHVGVFSELFIATVRAGELSGTLEGSFRDLAVQLTKSYDLNRKVRGAMVYPIIVIAAALGVGLGMSIFVLPRILTLFASITVKLPLSTRILMGFSGFLAKNWAPFFIALAAAIFGIWNLLQLRAVKPVTHAILLRLPIFGTMSRNFNLATFARTMATLLRSGISIGEAFQICSETIRNVRYKKALLKVKETIETGAPSSTVLEEFPHLFPPTATRMIAVGEHTGKLEETFSYLSEFYEDEVDSMTKNLSTIMEPVLLLLIGLAVGFVAIAVIMPVYNMINSIDQL
jgi:type IV pilus assembly protein PilC